MGEKALAILHFATLPPTSPEWQAEYSAACKRWSEKAVIAKCEDLISKGYMDCGVSARTGWLTDKGREALSRAHVAKGDNER